MLNNIPKVLSPELLAVLCEMGHSDRIVLGDANFPGRSLAEKNGAHFVRMDGVDMPTILDAILQLMPLDHCEEQPVQLMQKMECDKDLKIPIWDTYRDIVARYAPQGAGAVGFTERFAFYDEAKRAYCIVQTGEREIYANVMLQKGVVR